MLLGLDVNKCSTRYFREQAPQCQEEFFPTLTPPERAGKNDRYSAGGCDKFTSDGVDAS